MKIYKIRNLIAAEVGLKRNDIKDDTLIDDFLNSTKKRINRSKEYIDIPSKVKLF